MIIRKATLLDLATVTRISKKYRFEIGRNWKELLSSKTAELFLLVEDATVVGLTGLIHHDWNSTLQILDIFVIPKYRRKGFGLRAINFLISKANKTEYRCLIAEAPSLNPVVALYKSAGFRKCGHNDRYYSNGGKEIALWMSLDLR